MNKVLMALSCLVLAPGVQAQEAYKCKVNGTLVIQDRPCVGAVKRLDDMPRKVEFPAQSVETSSQAEKLEMDKKYIDERVKIRIYEREKATAAEQIELCDGEAQSIVQRISQISSSAPRGTPLDAANARNMQIDQQQRQTEIASLQTQHTAKLAQCNQLRQSFSQRFKN